MKPTLTLEEVIAFPRQLPLETVGFHWTFLLAPLLALICSLLLKKVRGDSQTALYSMAGTGFLLGSLSTFFLFVILMPANSPRSAAEYDAYYDSWVTEYVEPYIRELPIEELVIKEAAYNHFLEGKRTESEEGKTPVKVTDQYGRKHALWVTVVYEEDREQSELVYQELFLDLDFQASQEAFYLQTKPVYEAGFKNVRLYTGDKALWEVANGKGEKD